MFYLFFLNELIIYLIKSNSAAPIKPVNIAYFVISLSPPYIAIKVTYLTLKQDPK